MAGEALSIQRSCQHRTDQSHLLVRAKTNRLGDELLDAISQTIDLIRAHPEIGAPRPTQQASRQLRVNRFPYSVVYRVREQDIYVVAVAHYESAPRLLEASFLIQIRIPCLDPHIDRN